MHPEYTFNSHFIEIENHRLHYIDEGQGPVIVLIHGNPTWSFFYRKLISTLRRQHRVIAIDNIGCGFSDKPQNYDYTLENHIRNLTEILAELGVERCSLILHDWGGAIGMGYAVRNIAAIERIALFNTAAFRSKRIPLRIALCRIPVIGEILVRALNGFAFCATYMAVAKPMNENTRKYYLLPYNSWKNRIATHRFVKDIPLHRKHQSYKTLVEVENGLSRLREERVPLLILWGGKDFCFTREFYDEWQARFPEAEAHYFSDCGHYLLEDCFDNVEQYFTTFFKSNG